MSHDCRPSAFCGTFTALVTPLRNNQVDWPTLNALVERQIEAGVAGVVPCGSTGESATLSRNEHQHIIEAVVQRVAGRCKVLAGSGSSSTNEAIVLAQHAAAAGADAVLVVTPYYNRPTQEGLFRHYVALAEAVDLPIVLYNVPARCGVDLLNETILRLRQRHENIVAIKDASGGVDRVAELVARSDIAVLSGDDSLTLPLMALGAIGVISVISNLVPSWMKELVAAADNDLASARRWHHKTCSLADEIGRLGPNPVPIKTAMALKGLLAEEFRLPLCPLDGDKRGAVERALRRHEII